MFSCDLCEIFKKTFSVKGNAQFIFWRSSYLLGAVQKGRHRRNGNFWNPLPLMSPLVTISGYPPPLSMSPGKYRQTFIKNLSNENYLGSF